jgi:hypothetical protein
MADAKSSGGSEPIFGLAMAPFAATLLIQELLLRSMVHANRAATAILRAIAAAAEALPIRDRPRGLRGRVYSLAGHQSLGPLLILKLTGHAHLCAGDARSRTVEQQARTARFDP